MAEAKINEGCIIGLPTCGYAFSSSRMCFIAAPSDDEFRLEIDILQNLLSTKVMFEKETVRTLSAEQVEFYRRLWARLKMEVFVSSEVDKKKVEDRVRELTKDLKTPPWVLLNEADIQASIAKEYENIGEF